MRTTTAAAAAQDADTQPACQDPVSVAMSPISSDAVGGAHGGAAAAAASVSHHLDIQPSRVAIPGAPCGKHLHWCSY